MSKRRSQTERAAYAVKRRKEDYEAKRFNNPIRIFLERKYPKILEEFTELYKFINFINPGRKDLTKTLTFKQWLTENPAPLKNISQTTVNTFSSTILSVNRETETTTTANTFSLRTASATAPLKNISPPTTVNTFSSTIPSVNRETETTTTANTFSLRTASANRETENTFSSTMASANRETETTTTTSANRETETNTISDILDELFGPNGIPDEILSNEDEGIELNHFDELAFDIEPFDFLAETEGF